MSVRRKFADLLQYFNPFAANLEPPPPPLQDEDEDVPARKRPRLQASTRVSTADTVDTHAYTDAADTDTVTTASADDTVAVAPKDAVIVPASLPGASCERAPIRRWKPEEDAKLSDAVKKHGDNWSLAATLVPGRTNRQCRQRWTTKLDPLNGSKKEEVAIMGRNQLWMRRWTPEEDAKLIEAVRKLGNEWIEVAVLISGRTAQQCSRRWHLCRKRWAKPDVSLGNWTVEEDAKLTDAVKKFGNDWVRAAAMVPGRTNNACRKRWVFSLEPYDTTSSAQEEHDTIDNKESHLEAAPSKETPQTSPAAAEKNPVGTEQLQQRNNSFIHALLLGDLPTENGVPASQDNTANTPEDMDEPSQQTPQDKIFQSDTILNAVELELIWLGEESMHGLSCPEFRFDFIYEYASPALKVELRKFSHDESETEKLKQIVRFDDWLVARRFDFVRKDIRIMLRRGFRRESMGTVIAELRLLRCQQLEWPLPSIIVDRSETSPSNAPGDMAAIEQVDVNTMGEEQQDRPILTGATSVETYPKEARLGDTFDALTL